MTFRAIKHLAHTPPPVSDVVKAPQGKKEGFNDFVLPISVVMSFGEADGVCDFAEPNGVYSMKPDFSLPAVDGFIGVLGSSLPVSSSDEFIINELGRGSKYFSIPIEDLSLKVEQEIHVSGFKEGFS